MSNGDEIDGAGNLTPVSRSRTMAYRRAGTRPPVSEQAAGLRHDLACHHHLAEQGNPRARGAALAVGFAALRLAVTPVRAEDDRRRRDEALQNALPCLVRAGLGHIGSLVAAALAHDVDLARLVPSARGLQ